METPELIGVSLISLGSRKDRERTRLSCLPASPLPRMPHRRRTSNDETGVRLVVPRQPVSFPPSCRLQGCKGKSRYLYWGMSVTVTGTLSSTCLLPAWENDHETMDTSFVLTKMGWPFAGLKEAKLWGEATITGALEPQMWSSHRGHVPYYQWDLGQRPHLWEPQACFYKMGKCRHSGL